MNPTKKQQEPDIDDYRDDDDFPHRYIKDLEAYESEEEDDDKEYD